MIKALIDTNIIINIALAREPFYTDSAILFQKIDNKRLHGFISASAITDIFYLLRKETSYSSARKYLMELLQIIDILSVNKNTNENALLFDLKDFEDAVQTQVAIENGMDIIITRNPQDYKNLMSLQIITPRDFVEKY